MKEYKEMMWVLLIVAILLSMILGAARALDIGHCTYNRLIEFFPTYAIPCELFEIRWEK